MSNASDLILTDSNAEAEADELLASLSSIAYPVEQDIVVTDKGTKRRSKFFFKPSASLADEVDKLKDRFKPKKLVHVDDVIMKRLKKYKSSVPEELEANINSVREFFLQEIAPRSMAGAAGTSQALDIIQKLLGSEVDSLPMVQFDRMSREAVSILMANFIVDYYGLPKKAAQRLVESIQPRPRGVTVPIPPLAEAYESRHAKAKRTAGEKDGTDRKEHEEG